MHTCACTCTQLCLRYPVSYLSRRFSPRPREFARRRTGRRGMEAKGLTNDALRALFLPKPSVTAAPAVAAPAVAAVPAADRDDGSVVQEGLARLRTEGTFYNQKSVLQRDLTVLALRTWLQQRQAPAVVLDAMAGSGVRALRYLLEVPQVGTSRTACLYHTQSPQAGPREAGCSPAGL